MGVQGGKYIMSKTVEEKIFAISANLQLFAGEGNPIETTNDTSPEVSTGSNDSVSDANEITKEDFKQLPFLRKYQNTLKQKEPEKEVKKDTLEGEPEEKEDVKEGIGEETTDLDNPENKDSGNKEVQIGDDAKIKLADGTEITIAELKKGYMMQADYTRKTQALAEERKALEKERSTFDKEQVEKALQLQKELERDPIGTLDKLREQYEEQGIFEPKDPETLAKEDEIRRLKEEKLKLEQEKIEREQQETFDKIKTELDSLAEKYGDKIDINNIVQFMIDNNFYDPERAMKALYFDVFIEEKEKALKAKEDEIKKAKESAVNEYIQSKTKKQETKPPLGTSTTGSPPVTIQKPKTFQEARKAALARLEGEN